MRNGNHTTSASILIVDDTVENLRLLSAILSKHGYMVRPVPDGAAALKSIRLKVPDLILLDIMMPNMDGYSVCEALKMDEQTQHIPIIFVSALHDVMDKVKAFSLGGVDYITKPFQPEEVLARVTTHLTLSRLQQQVSSQNQQLQQINLHLGQSIDELERRNLEMNLLSRMSSTVQRAESIDEAFHASIRFLQQLFAEQSGALYNYNQQNQHLEMVASWGNPSPLHRVVLADACAACARGRVYLTQDCDTATCQCACATDQFPYLCIHMVCAENHWGCYICAEEQFHRELCKNIGNTSP